ncbi:unnamed protein product [Adineta ricciae]|uniref:Fibronectin type-III domain-containing protein n=1 Tax=Adineta ricciae TaxID=249248 RepID=A0A814PVN9_ADIRI|nr:unnamed protein product [Adineta ricciae]CAF1111119.1 unnamed protein product [Adineta ricciae]
MSSTENWLKLFRWWQEHLKCHSLSTPTIDDQRGLLQRHPSSTSTSSVKTSQKFKMKKRASFGEVDEHQVGYNDFRHVRDSIRGKNPLTTRITPTNAAYKRRNFRRSTTYDLPSDDNDSNENTFVPSKLSSMSKLRNRYSRRLSLVKFELSPTNSCAMKDEHKSIIPSCSPNLIQKLLFKQFSTKTRPCTIGISSDDNTTTTVLNDTPPNRRRTSTASSKHSCLSLSPSPNSKSHSGETSLLPVFDKALSKSQQSDLNAYLSKRRNTTGSISINKLVDLKNVSNVHSLKITSAHNSSNKIAAENIFQTVEDSDFLGTKHLIHANENLVNSYNEHDWCPLDVAIMLNNISMIRLLLHYGAEESLKIQPEEVRYQSVCQQLVSCTELTTNGSIKKSSSNRLAPDDATARRLSPSSEKQSRHRRPSKSQQQQLNQQRSLMLSQMKDNYEQAVISASMSTMNGKQKFRSTVLVVKNALRFLITYEGKTFDLTYQKRVPDAPTNVRLIVTGSDNITVTFDEPLRSNGIMVVKYKIEWSFDENFTDVTFDIIKNCFLREYVIRNLPVGQRCYVRVSAGNLKGFGQTVLANPPYCTPSNWREFSKTSRINICDLRFEEILNKILNDREGNESNETSNLRNRRRSYGTLRKNIRQLFQIYPRLARSMKRGLYLVSVMFNGDRILVTNEDVLPMVEVDENYGHNLLADFQWFMKLTFVWDDLKSLRPDLQRCSSVTSFYLRIKLVQAAIELQTLEEINNLGRLHHTYIRDNDGNVAFVLINDLSSDTRANICPSNLKWISTTKFFETMKNTSNNSCLQQISDKLPEMIEFYHASMRRLDSGLYVAYLKMQNSVDSLRVMVNKHMPGSLPCTKIRSNANVSREEWEWLHNNQENSVADDSLDNSLESFKTQFRNATKELFVVLNLPESHFSNSRIYNSQVVEIRDDLSLIILMSTADEVNILSNPSNHSLTSFIYLPVYIFEILQHLSNNYRFICQYSRVSICLDFELICAQQNQREAFSINELDETRYRLNHLLACQQDLDDIWRLSRWLVHVINCAKDKTYFGISLKSFRSKTDSAYENETCFIEKSDSGFIDIEDHSIELTFYISLLTSNAFIPITIRLNKMMKLNEILQMILKQQQENLQDSHSSLNFIWVHSNGREYMIEDHLTAYDIQKRLVHFGGQIYLCSKDLPVLQATQSVDKTSWLFPPTNDRHTNEKGSNLSLNI